MQNCQLTVDIYQFARYRPQSMPESPLPLQDEDIFFRRQNPTVWKAVAAISAMLKRGTRQVPGKPALTMMKSRFHIASF